MDNIDEKLIDSEIKMLKLGGISSKFLQMPIIRDIIGFELSRCDKGETRSFFNSREENNSWSLSTGTAILGGEVNYTNLEYYHIRLSGDKVIIEVGDRGNFSKDGIRITADKEGNMLKAEFIVEDSKVELPTPNKKMKDLERFLKYQRELEKQSEKALLSLFQSMRDKRKFEKEVQQVKTNTIGIKYFIASDFEKLSSNKKQLFLDVLKEIDSIQEDKNKGNEK